MPESMSVMILLVLFFALVLLALTVGVDRKPTD
jgi:hypothetical protein